MKLLPVLINKLDRGRGDFVTAMELAASALLLTLAMRWLEW